MKTLKVRLTLTEEMLGTASADPHLHETYIASKAPDAPSVAEEVEAVGVAAAVENAMTIFPRNDNGEPIMWDYQIKGFFKDACSMLRTVPGYESSKIKAYKKTIDGRIFVSPRMIPLVMGEGDLGNCQRPLRAATPQGERIALANSETVPAGTTLEFEVKCLQDGDISLVKEWLDYGELRGLGQWRNSGKGTFLWQTV